MPCLEQPLSGNNCRGGYKDLVELFVNKGADNWDYVMSRAARGGHKDLVEYFINKGVDDWNEGMYWAARGGHKDLVEYFINKGVDDWNEGSPCRAKAFPDRATTADQDIKF